MSNRYVTEAEKAGTKRRVAAYRANMRAQGYVARTFMITDAERTIISAVLNVWREQPTDLSAHLVSAAKALKPAAGTGVGDHSLP